MRNLAVTAGGFSGVSSCREDRSGVWFEGTAHLADALEYRGNPGDGTWAARYVSVVYYAQAHGLNHDGIGIIAASRDGLSDCGGGSDYPSLPTRANPRHSLCIRRDGSFLMSAAP